MALTVLDRHGHLITCLPWTQKAMESEESWVKLFLMGWEWVLSDRVSGAGSRYLFPPPAQVRLKVKT
ncbi:MAG: hypothetical protein LKKZDAJK_002732 [Candidatus Fervidibacter sp.]